MTDTEAHTNASVEKARVESGSWRTRIEPAHVLVTLVVVAVLAMSVGPIADIDSYWHVLIGREILSSHHIANTGAAWSLIHPANGWVTSQWLAEVTMAKAQQWFGWRGLLWWRLLFTCALLSVAVWAVMRRARPMVGALVLAVVLLPTVGELQERPFLVSLVFTAWLGAVVKDVLCERPPPKWWTVGLLVLLWSQFHGMWVLAPAMLGLLALARWADLRRRAWPTVRPLLVLTLVAGVAGCISPVGPRGLLLPLTFSKATGVIEEWQATTMWDAGYLSLLALTIALVWIWIRRVTPVAPSQLIVTLALNLFALTAARNVMPSLLLLAPLAAAVLTSAFGPRRAKTSPREGVVLAVACVVLAVLGLTYTVAKYAQTDALAKAKPLEIAAYLAEQGGAVRVLNGYNVSGVLAAFGGPGVQLAIDGRADRDGSAYITDYLHLEDLQGAWQPLFRSIDPDYVVLGSQSPLTWYLTEVQHWSSVATDNGYVLLAPPPGWSLDRLGNDGTSASGSTSP